MRLLVCAAASVLLVSDYALALDDTPTQPTYVAPHEAVRAAAPVRRQEIAAVLPAKPPATQRAPTAVLARKKFTPPPCRALRCAPELPARGWISGSP